MRWNTFPRALAFAALASAGVAAWLIFAGPVLGGAVAVAVSLVVVTSLYLGGLAPDLRRRVSTAVVTAGVAGGIALAASSLTEEILALAILVATARSVFLFRLPVARAVVVEAVLIGTGLLFARFLAAPSLGGTILAI